MRLKSLAAGQRTVTSRLKKGLAPAAATNFFTQNDNP